VSGVVNVVVILALVAANAFFVVGEYAVVTARRGPLAERAAAGHAGARAALRLMDDPVRVISTVQVGITALGILVGAIGEPLVRDLLGDAIPSWLAFVIGFSVVTYLSVVLGELVPKALTLDRAERLAAAVARPIEAISVVLRPAVWLLQASAAAILRPFGVRDVVAGETVASADDLRALVDEAERAGVIPRSQEEMLHNVFAFPTREAAEVMVPAPDVAWLDAGLDARRALAAAVETGHSRYPVGRGTLDEVVGIVHMRDLAAAAGREPPPPIAGLARPALFVPETKDLGALLREMRRGRQQLAVVVDEYGDTAGVVPLEDVLEQVVGEIEDEFDLPDGTITRIDEHVVDVAGSMTVDDFNEALGTAVAAGDVRTLAGAVFHALGRLPDEGEEVTLAGVRLTVAARRGTRITRLRAELPAGEGPDAGPPG
jgi:putative hemolysin